MTFQIQEFRTWQKDVVTEALFKALREVREEVEFKMKDSALAFDSQCQIKLANLHGIREALDLVLEMTFEEIKSEESIDDKKKTASSGL